MTAFRSSALALVVLLAAAGTAPAQAPSRSGSAPSSGPAGADSASPFDLGPRATPGPTAGQPASPAPDPTAPIRLGPRRAVIPSPAPAPSRRPATSGPAINVETLETVDADSVGTLDDAQGGLGIDMWQGTERAQVRRWIALLPRRLTSPAMRDLMRRLLLTRAAAPPSDGNGPGLFDDRVAALVALGDRPSSRALIDLAPAGARDEQLLRTRAESWFYRYNAAEACRIVQGPAQGLRSIYWLQATAFCLAIAGKTAEASLVTDILDERGEKAPPVFFSAMEAIAGAKVPRVKNLKTTTGLHLAMMRAAKLPVPASALEKASPSALAAIAAHPETPVDLRLAAAEEAARLGTLQGRALFEIYGDAGKVGGDLAAMLEKAAAEWGPRSRAVLVRAAARYDVPAARAEVLQQALKLAHQRDGFGVVALAAQPLLQGMPPGDELRWFAPQAARALLATNQRAAAEGWIALGLNAKSDETAGGDLWPIWALTRGGETALVTPDAVAQWWRAQDRTADGVAMRARVLFTLLEAEGRKLPGTLWAEILDQPRQDAMAGPSDAVRHALASAAAGNRRGETVALALLALGEPGPDPANLLAVELAVEALRKVGLADDARRLVLETALAAGL